MGALVAILQTDPNLLRCQVARLDAHVSLRDGERLPDAYGFGHYGGGSVLLGKRPTGASHALALGELVGQLDAEALLVHARYASVGKAKDENRIDELDLDAAVAARALAGTVKQLESWCREAGAPRPSRLNFVATNGRIMVATRRNGPLHYALLEGILPCAVHGIDLQTPESDPRVRPHRRAKAVAFANRLRSQNGFIEVPEGNVVAVSRSLQVSISPLAAA